MNKEEDKPKATGPQMVVHPAEKGVFVISYDGRGFAAKINGQSLTELLEIARKSIVAQIKEEKKNARQEEGEEVRTED